MRVIALVSLVFALLASSMPLASRAGDQSVGTLGTEGGKASGTLGAAGSEIGKAAGSSTASGETVSKQGSTVPGSVSGPLGGRSTVNPLGTTVGKIVTNAGKSTSASKSTSGTKSTIGTQKAPLRLRTTTAGAGTIVDTITGHANDAGKVAQGKVPSGTGSTAKGAAVGAAGPLAGSST